MMLAGTWIPQGAEFGGQTLPMPDARLIIAGEHYVIETDGERHEGRLVVDVTVTPHTIDLVGTAGPHAGRTIPALFRLRGNLLQLCYVVGEDTAVAPRPATMDTGQGSMQMLVRYRRVTDERSTGR